MDEDEYNPHIDIFSINAKIEILNGIYIFLHCLLFLGGIIGVILLSVFGTTQLLILIPLTLGFVYYNIFTTKKKLMKLIDQKTQFLNSQSLKDK